MRNATLKALFLGLWLTAGCQLLVDPDPKEIGQTGAVADACKDLTCKEGTHCALTQVQCVKEPCDPVAQCISDDLGPKPVGDGDQDDASASGQACGKATCAEGTVCCNASCGICTKPGQVCTQVACGDEPAKPTCAATTCPTGTDCVEGPNGAECKKPEATSCATVLCAPNTYCDDIAGQAKCIPLPSCEGTSCEKGTHCELNQVTCIRAPCPPQPTCVVDEDPCALADCASGSACTVVDGKAVCQSECQNPCLTAKCNKSTHCEAKEVQCIKAPCCPVAACVSNTGPSKACGDNTCSAGTYCCNESCGTCAPIGGACTQQICSRQN
ncbi:MAG: hypothetical protein QM778_03950 [Myxococcales bacterium]